jgi:predicted GNAT family acetyltransferase
MEMKITHDQEDFRFFAEVEGEEAELTYTFTEDEEMDFDYTFVPEGSRGQGIADKLVKAGLEFARKKEYKVIASCPVVEAFVERHPTYKNILA